MTHPANDQEKRLAQLKREVPKRGFDRHASVLKNVSELPGELQSPAITALATREVIHTIIAFPPQLQHGWDYVPRQALLFTQTGVIHLIASIWPDQEPKVTCLKGSDLMYMKVTLLLLYGSLEIVAKGDTSTIRLEMEFNTVAWCFMSLPLRQLLQLTRVTRRTLEDKITDSQATQLALRKLPLKFSNGVEIYGLLPGEGLDELVFQPCLWQRWWVLFRRPVLANTLLMLTTNYMTVIQEELGIEQGWILTYIPRDCIREMQNLPCDLYNEVIVGLKKGEQKAKYRVLLKSDAAEDWRIRWIQHGGQWKDLSGQTAMN